MTKILIFHPTQTAVILGGCICVSSIAIMGQTSLWIQVLFSDAVTYQMRSLYLSCMERRCRVFNLQSSTFPCFPPCIPLRTKYLHYAPDDSWAVSDNGIILLSLFKHKLFQQCWNLYSIKDVRIKTYTTAQLLHLFLSCPSAAEQAWPCFH